MLKPVVTPHRRWIRSFGPTRRRFGDVIVHPDGARLIAAEDDGSVTMYDLREGCARMRLPALLSAWELAVLRLHPDGVRLFDTALRSHHATLQVDNLWIRALAIRNALVAACASDGAVSIWDLQPTSASRTGSAMTT